MLDRGTTQDWFGSGEIVVEAVLAGLGLYLFTVHMLTRRSTASSRERSSTTGISSRRCF